MSGLDCDSCESKLHLAYGEKILTLSSGEKIAVEHTPFLVCDVCQKIYISPLAKELLDELKKLVESAEQEEEKNTIEVNQVGIFLCRAALIGHLHVILPEPEVFRVC